MNERENKVIRRRCLSLGGYKTGDFIISKGLFGKKSSFFTEIGPSKLKEKLYFFLIYKGVHPILPNT
ncbi:MAG: hypothetical protein DRN30_06515 [Thermoplasmata archaeon]|nr:MAG: hypothetical protein DRN30_06515 [Thermoplasmata archaeon]